MYIIMCYIPKRIKWYFGTMVQWYFLVLLQEKMRALFLCISKLNRTFDCVLGTPSWICNRKNEFSLLHISKLNRTFASDI